MLDQHVVLDHRDLRVALALAHHHQAFHVLAAGQEILLHQLVLAAALAAVVAAALLLGLQTGRALHIGDLVDVLLLARTAGQRLLLLVRGLGPAATAATARDGLLLVILILAGGLTGMLLMPLARPIVVRTILAVAAARTATATARRPLLLVIGFGGVLLVDRQIRDLVEFEVLLDLLDLGRGATLLGVQTARTARRTRRLLVGGVGTLPILGTRFLAIAARIGLLLAAAGTTPTRQARLVLLTFLGLVAARVTLILTAAGAARTGTAGGGTLVLVLLTVVIVALDGARAQLRQHRLLEQQRRHRTRMATRLMALRQRLDRVERTGVAGRVVERRLEDALGPAALGGIGGTARTTTRRRLLLLVMGRCRLRLGLLTARQMRLLEQRHRMVLHLQRHGGAGRTHLTGDAASATAARRGRRFGRRFGCRCFRQ